MNIPLKYPEASAATNQFSIRPIATAGWLAAALLLAACGGNSSPGGGGSSGSVAGGGATPDAGGGGNSEGGGSGGGQGSGSGSGGSEQPGEPRSVSISPQRRGVDEGDSSGGTAVFIVRLSAAATGSMSVELDATAGSAGSDDFTAPATSVSFSAGDIEQQVEVAITADTVLETYETIGLTLVNPSSNLTIDDATAFVTINNDDSGADDDTASACSGGATYHVTLDSAIDEETVSFQVLEPTVCSEGSKHPLLLQGHGYSGSRTTAADAFPDLRGAGYGVISFDQRGHGDSGGTIRVLDPDFAGQDLLRALDWAEANLDWLEYRDDANNIVDVSAADANLNLGAFGGSYGGGYQHLILAVDPKNRLDALVPEITWHDLTYSLNPGNVVKGGWALVLSGAGEGGSQGRTDPFVRATLAEGAGTNVIPEQALPFFSSHSLTYHCSNELNVQVGDSGSSAEFTTNPITGNIEATSGGNYTVGTPRRTDIPAVDVLYYQGIRDTLFNLNEAHENYRCLEALGGDVRLYSYQSGHNILFPGAGASAEAIGSQSGLPGSLCGSAPVATARLAWFEEKMRGIAGVDAILDPDDTGFDTCLSLRDGLGVLVNEMPIGGTEFDIAVVPGQPVPVSAGADITIPLQMTTEVGQVVAGIPTIDITVELPGAGSSVDSDAILFLALGRQGPATQGNILPIDNQFMPIRGLGRHQIDMVGVGEELDVNDQLFLIVTRQNQQYPTFSRDPTAAALVVSGTVNVPLLSSSDYSVLD